MANPFNLTNGGKTYTFDDTGTVTSGGAASGTWTVDNKNNVVINPGGGAATIPIPVGWGFNGSDQISLYDSNGTWLWSLSNAGGNSPVLALTSQQQLVVTPNAGAPFSFNLIGQWAMTPSHDITFTINGKLSTITQGYLEDDSSKCTFNYHHYD